MGEDICSICNWQMTLLKDIIQTNKQAYESVKKKKTTKYDVEETCYSSGKVVCKECSISSFLRGCKLNSIDTAVCLLKWLKLKTLAIPKVCKDIKQRKVS